MHNVEDEDPALWKEINRAYLSNDEEALASTPLKAYRRLLRESGSWFVPGRVSSDVALKAALSPYEGLVFDQYNKLKQDLNMQPYAELARLVTGMNLTYIGMLTKDHSRLLSQAGYPAAAIGSGIYPRSEILCQFTAARSKGIVTEFRDIPHDQRLVNHPINTGTGPGSLRSYIGVPLTTVLGTSIGTLCCMDPAPRESGWTPAQQAGLRQIGELIMKDLDLQVDRALALDAKQVFVTSVNHELKTPVHGLLASAELLKAHRATESQPSLSSFEAECLGTIEHCANTLVDVIDNVLSFANIEPDSDRPALLHDSEATLSSEDKAVLDHNLTSVDLVEFVEQIVDSCWAGKLSSGKDLMVIYNADLKAFKHRLLINRGELSRIILNILGNACKYTEAGYVLIELGSRIRDDQPNIMDITLRITDTGKGMPESFISSGDVFKPFVQANGKSEGVGLGMSIVKTFIEKGNGKITVESKVNEGTSIGIHLPLSIDHSYTTVRSVQYSHAGLIGKRFHITQDTETSGSVRLKEFLSRTCIEQFGMVQAPLITADVIISHSAERVRQIFEQGIKAPCLLAASVRDWIQPRMEDPLVHLVQLPIGPGKLSRALTEVCKSLEHAASASLAVHDKKVDTDKMADSQSLHTNINGKRTRSPEIKASLHEHHPSSSTCEKIAPLLPSEPFTAGLATLATVSTRPRVLCVDDNAINLRILQTVVAKQNVPHDSALNGAEAVQKYTMNEAGFDLIFMDVNMPLKNGLDATQEIRSFERDNNIRRSTIIGLSAGGSAQNKLCLEAGMDGYCDKPVSVKSLAAMIKNWVV